MINGVKYIMMNILYTIDNSLYINITNKCPCSCTFCIRKEMDGLKGSGSLWMDRDPSVEEVIDELKKENLDLYKEIVFCGYGEPLVRIHEVVEVAKYIKSVSRTKIRINTTGLSDLIHNEKDTAKLLTGAIDAVSISLNAPSAEEYVKVTRPKFGEIAFDTMIEFAKEVKKNIGDVAFSVVDVINEEQIKRCKELSDKLEIPLRVRHKEENEN